MAKQKARLALLGVVVLLVGLALQVMTPNRSYANEILQRSLTLQDRSSSNGSEPGVAVNHLFGFEVPSTTKIKSILFQYCTTADGTCTEPTGVVTAGATLGTQTGLTFNSLNVATEGSPFLVSTGGVTPTANQPVTFQLLGVVNPSTANYTFYVRISTYVSNNATGSPVDSGNVTASTAQQINLTGIMPESLVFCTGGTVSTTAGVPDCTTATSGNITFNADFSPIATAFTTSQMAASTNAGSGYAITVDGPTLTSGSNSIAAIGSTAAVSTLGTPQFGLNLVSNTTPTVGSAIAPASDGVNYFGAAIAPFKTTNQYAFTADTTGPFVANLNSVANSANGGGSSLATDAQIYTVSYIVNVPGRQGAGTYTTTLTYICTPTF